MYKRQHLEAVGPAPWLTLATGWADVLTSLEGEEWRGLYGDRQDLPPRLVAVRLAVVLRPDPERRLERNLRIAGVEQVVVQHPTPAPGSHAIDHLLQVLAPLQVPTYPVPRIRHPAMDETGEADRTAVFLHPGSGGRHKRWPTERFLTLARALKDQGRHPILLLGPIELEQGEAAIWQATGLPLRRAPDLWSLAGELARARLFIGNDSGVSHLAAAVGCPILTLFGASDPTVWAPRGWAPCRVLRAPGGDFGGQPPGANPMEALPTDAVLKVIDDFFGTHAPP